MRQRIGGAGTGWRGTLLLFVFAGAFCSRDVPPASDAAVLAITLHPAGSRAQPAYVSVSGLVDKDLSGLRGRAATDSQWLSLMTITVASENAGAPETTPVEGRYGVTDTTVTFTPLFPFDPGRAYRVRFDPSHLSRPRAAAPLSALVQLPAAATEPTTVVTAVHPDADVVPANLLRVYIEFSAPMGDGTGVDFVRLVELSGSDGAAERVEADAFLPVAANFWSPDHRRYTLFFDPGRVKEGVGPNRQRGRPLRSGGRYALDIAAGWTDANGLPLKTGHRRTFRVGPVLDEGLVLADWMIEPPVAGSRDHLLVRFPRPLDHGILARALSVEAAGRGRVEGDIGLGSNDTAWTFTPVAPWPSGEYNLVAQSFLEDPQGNQIGRAFETFANDQTPDRAGLGDDDGPFRIPFTIGAP